MGAFCNSPSTDVECWAKKIFYLLYDLIVRSNSCRKEGPLWRMKKWKYKSLKSCPTLCNPVDFTFHGILQARIVEWVAFPFSRGSSQPRDRTQVFCMASGSFISWATGKPCEGWDSTNSQTWEGPPSLCHLKQPCLCSAYSTSAPFYSQVRKSRRGTECVMDGLDQWLSKCVQGQPCQHHLGTWAPPRPTKSKLNPEICAQ